MKKILPIIGLCSILYFSGINSSPVLAKDDYIQVKEGKGYVYTVSENEGNKQLHGVAKTAEKEDAWIYTASKWYDIGKSEEKNTVSIAPLEDVVKLLKKNYKSEKEAKFVHIHPKTVVKEWVAPPSVYDLAVHGKLKRMLRDKLQIRLISEVYTGSGVWTYDITDALEEDIHNAAPGKFSKWMIIESMINKETFLTLGNDSLSKKEKIENYVSEVKKLGVILYYEHLEK